MKNLLFAITLLLAATGVQSQNYLITVERAGTDLFFSSMDSLVANTMTGDTIKFPGGTFLIPGSLWLIDEQVHIIGVGHRPDSSSATLRTSLIGNINVRQGAEFGSLQGIHLSGNLTMAESGVNNTAVSDFFVSRCYIGGVLWLQNSGTGNNTFAECIFSNDGTTNNNNACVQGGDAQAVTFRNCFFKIYVLDLNNCTFENNIFLSAGDCITEIYNCVFSGNIFLSTSSVIGNTNNSFGCVFQHNVYVSSSPNYGTNSSVSELTNQSQTSIFVDQSGNLFDYGDDYHLQVGSPANTAGVNNGQAGVYGGTFPFKDNAHPATPRIQNAKVNSSTDSNGNLQVEFIIEAQDN